LVDPLCEVKHCHWEFVSVSNALGMEILCPETDYRSAVHGDWPLWRLSAKLR